MNYNAVISVNDLTVGIPTEPVTLAEFKNYIRSEGFQDPSSVVPETPISATLAQASTTYQNNLLIGAVILSLARSGTVYTQALSVGNLTFTFDSTTGTITFQNAGNTGGEPLAINYGFSNGSGVFNFTGDDTLMTDLITMARELIERIAGISIVNHTWEAILNYTNVCRKVMIQRGPYVSITTVKDKDGNTIDPTAYTVTGNFQKYFSSSCLCGTYTIQYTAGYVTLPKALKIDIMRLAAYMYENRGDDTTVQSFGFQLASKYIPEIVS